MNISEASDIKIGNSSVSAVYLGSQLLWLQGAKILCKYNVSDTSSPVTLYNALSSSSMKVDGVEQEIIDEYTFDTTGEHTVLFILPEGVTSIDEDAFSNCSELTSITIGNSVTSIGDYAFDHCGGLTSITISNSVTSIGQDAFSNCTGLTSVTIGNSVTSIGYEAFYNCSGLTSITIPDSVTSIGGSAFSYCIGLTSITIPDSVTSIGNQAFYRCTRLTSITCNATTAPTIVSSTFRDIKTNGTLTVPVGSTGYDVWMGTGNYYLGKYKWTKVEQ